MDYLLDITGGHPYYTQLLCRELYFYAISHNTIINNEAVEIALQEAILAEEIYFSKIWEEIANNSAQINILNANFYSTVTCMVQGGVLGVLKEILS